jgi:lipopolysaccharide export system permease protein
MRFVSAILGVFLTVFILIFTIDLVELMRRAGEAEGATHLKLARLALFRTPAVAEQVLPFAILFAALATFLNLSRKLELVVARAAGRLGLAVFAPIIVVAALTGIFATTVYNPVATKLKDDANQVEIPAVRPQGSGGSERGRVVSPALGRRRGDFPRRSTR